MQAETGSELAVNSPCRKCGEGNKENLVVMYAVLTILLPVGGTSIYQQHLHAQDLSDSL